jgi:hypothetical protein
MMKEDGETRGAAENGGTRQRFEDAWAALLNTEKHLKETFRAIEEANREMRKIIGDAEE